MPRLIKAKDNTTGKKFEFNWDLDRNPTDDELTQIHSKQIKGRASMSRFGEEQERLAYESVVLSLAFINLGIGVPLSNSYSRVYLEPPAPLEGLICRGLCRAKFCNSSWNSSHLARSAGSSIGSSPKSKKPFSGILTTA